MLITAYIRQIIKFCLVMTTCSVTAYADDEGSNRAHIAAAPYGQCYAKSVPEHIYDPDDRHRQQGYTDVYRVEDSDDVLIRKYDWFAQRIFILCSGASEPILVRVGPWHRGHDPHADDLALAFYSGGKLLKKYSTLDIAGGALSDPPSFTTYKNVSASVSHYTVFEQPPEFVRLTHQDGAVFSEEWVVRAVTIDGRELVFKLETGELQ